MRTLVLGFGVSGRSAAALAARLGHRVLVYDSQPDAASEILTRGFAAVTGPWDPMHLDGVDLVVASPGFPERSAPIVDAYERGLDVEGEIEFGWRHLQPPLTVAVTGTNGKTTVTELTSRMLSAAGIQSRPVGNIGDPVSDLVGNWSGTVVIEVSSFQLKLCRTFRPEVAVITNVAADHLDWHGSVADYRAAKARIGMNQRPEDVIVYPTDDPGAVEAASHSAARHVPIPPDRVAGRFGRVDETLVLAGRRVPLAELSVTGGPFLVDLLLAGAAADAAGAATEAIVEVARSFRPGAHRRQSIGIIAGVEFVDDSKATNPHAAISAIDSYPSVVLVAGGQAKGLDIAQIVTRPSVRHAVVMGESAGLLAAAAPDRVEVVSSMEEAVRTAIRLARPGDVVLLSPGGASFDMFHDYAHRGDDFATAVAAAAEEVHS